MVKETIGMVEFSLIKKVSASIGLARRLDPFGKQRTFNTVFEEMVTGPEATGDEHQDHRRWWCIE